MSIMFNNLINPDSSVNLGGYKTNIKGFNYGLTTLGFNNLYPMLLVELYEKCITENFNIPIDYELIQFIKKFHKIQDKNSSEYKLAKIRINTLYGRELRDVSISLTNLKYQFLHQIYNNLVEQGCLVYMDVDEFYISGDFNLNFLDINIKYSTKYVDAIYVLGETLVVMRGNSVMIRGYGLKNNKEIVLNEMRRGIRNCNIKNILE